MGRWIDGFKCDRMMRRQQECCYYNMQRIPVAVQVVSCISNDVATADQFNFKLFTIHKCGEEHVCT